MNLQVKKITNNMANSNTFVVSGQTECVIIDAGASVQDVLKAVGTKVVKGVLLTHSHFDHILHLDEYIEKFNCPIYMHPSAYNCLFDAKLNFSTVFDYNFAVQNKNFNKVFLKNQEPLTLIENVAITPIFANGHSKDSVLYLINNCLFAGDVLFASGIGRYDFYSGAKAEMLQTLKTLVALTGYDTVYSGHGAESTYERQQRNINLHIKFLNRH